MEEPAKEIVKEKLVRLEKNQENEVLLEESVSRKEWSILPRFRKRSKMTDFSGVMGLNI